MKLAANITLLFADSPLEDRPARAAAAGFDGVECLFPYAVPASVFATSLRAAKARLALINTPEPDWAKGARGCAAIPGQEARFAQALAYAHSAGAGRIHVLSGCTEHGRARETLIANLRSAAAEAPDMPPSLAPLNTHEHPGYWLDGYDKAASVIEAAGLSSLSLQYDAWHAARITGDPLTVWRTHAPMVGNVQIAGLAARGAPDPENALEATLIRAIAQGFSGWVAAEYLPKPGNDHAWLPALRCVAAVDGPV